MRRGNCTRKTVAVMAKACFSEGILPEEKSGHMVGSVTVVFSSEEDTTVFYA